MGRKIHPSGLPAFRPLKINRKTDMVNSDGFGEEKVKYMIEYMRLYMCFWACLMRALSSLV